jgi:replicative DNA helicase Mcm
MTQQDRSALHEAMESQRISVAKAGITATLQCRCSLLAAANPKFGRFDNSATITKQIDLPPALMSRFDLIFVMTDKPNSDADRELTAHILNVHRRGQARQIGEEAPIVVGVDINKIREETEAVKPVYDQETMRKYIAYSKRIIPVMTDEAMKIIEESYLTIRGMGANENDSVPITARQLEAYVRLSEASARMRLSNAVEKEDADRAVKLVDYYLNRIFATETGQLDADILLSGTSKKDRERLTTGEIYDLIDEFGTPEKGISESELVLRATKAGFTEKKIKETLEKGMTSGNLYSPGNGFYKRA